MTIESIKRRRRRAVTSVAWRFANLGFAVYRSHGGEADLEISIDATLPIRIKVIKVCLDKPTTRDLSWLLESPQRTKRELWVSPYGEKPILYNTCQAKKRTRNERPPRTPRSVRPARA
jgi:hypothetical protein